MIQDQPVGARPKTALKENATMTLRGIVRTAELVENPPGSEAIEMRIQAQGVGPNQPRRFTVPYELLLADDSLDPELVQGHAFQADVAQNTAGTWVAESISFASRVLRPKED
jgi:hypothetical protein